MTFSSSSYLYDILHTIHGDQIGGPGSR